MQAPKNPTHEINRQAALNSLEILDTDEEERFDRITRLTKLHFGVSIALVSLVDSERQWFKSKQGLSACETPRNISFCGHAILSEDIFYITDTLEDQRFFDNPLVTGPPHIRFYAGAPLHAPSGERIGTLCIIDSKPHNFSSDELKDLRDYADIVESELAQGHLLKVQLGLKNTEESLIDYAKRLSLATKAGNIGIWEYNLKNNKLVWDDKMLELYNIESQFSPKSYLEWQLAIHPDDATKTEQQFYQALKSNEAFDSEFRAVWPNGETHYMKLSTLSIRDNNGQVIKMIGVNQDISSTKRMELAAKLYESIIQSSEDAIFSKSLDGLISSWNRGAQKMFGYSAKQIIGQPVNTLLPEELSQEENSLLEKITLGETVESFETIRVTQSGERLDISVTVSPIFDDQGKVKGVSTIARDISERKKLDKLKSQFVSTVSHELRTPLTSINGSLGLVLGKYNKDLPAKVKKLLEIALRNGDRLSLLINDILDLEKLQSDRLEFNFNSEDLVNLANQALEDNTGFAEKHKVSMIFNTNLKQALVSVDQHRLLQVFSNLISNAVKFSPENGQVIITIKENDFGFRVSVKDSGKGIPLNFRDRIFQRFAQADHSHNTLIGGSGLGLSICKKIVEYHKGVIDYKTELDVGTEFYFDLPAITEVIKNSTDKSAGTNV